jgi:MinD-like ATPase involved in chromosome partitioning or flagellar assembly
MRSSALAGRRQRSAWGFLPAILATGIRVAADEGHPTVISDPDSSQAKAFFQVAENLAAQISIRGVKGELGQEIRISF